MTPKTTLLRSAFVMNTGNMSGRVISGASFQFLGIGLRTAITLGSTAVLARLLAPADFGYVAMATVVTEFAALFANFGFNNLLIQRRRINRLQIDTVFWASAALGAALAGIVFVASFFAGWLFADPRVGELLRVLCLTFFLSGLPTVPGVVLARLMHFRTQFRIQMATVVLRTLVAIGLACSGFGMWSLVAGGVAGALFQVVFAFVAVPYLPRLRFQSSFLTSTWRTSSSYFGSGLLYYANMNLDLLLIGRQLGATQLGYYQNARSLTDEIRARIAMPLQQVLFPAFAAMQDERERMQHMVLRSGRMLAAVVIPLGVGLSAMAQELVPVLYGPKWLAMVPVMSMFGLSAALRAATAIATPLFNANNRISLALKYNVVGTAMMMIGIWLALPYGLETVATTVAGITLYNLLPFRAALGLIGLKSRHVGHILGPPFLASFLLWLFIAVLRPYSFSWFSNPGAVLALHVFAGGAVYLIALHMLSGQYFADFKDAIRRLLSRVR